MELGVVEKDYPLPMAAPNSFPGSDLPNPPFRPVSAPRADFVKNIATTIS